MITTKYEEIIERLSKPFEKHQWKPQMLTSTFGLYVPYIDARDVIQRLNETCIWQQVPNKIEGSFFMTLKIYTEEHGWLERGDVGFPPGKSGTEVHDKGAVSDSLKRACVHYMLGHYIYNFGVFKFGTMVDTKKVNAKGKIIYAPKVDGRVLKRPDQINDYINAKRMCNKENRGDNVPELMNINTVSDAQMLTDIDDPVFEANEKDNKTALSPELLKQVIARIKKQPTKEKKKAIITEMKTHFAVTKPQMTVLKQLVA